MSFPTWKAGAQILRFRGGAFAFQMVARSLIFGAAPIISGLIVRAFFDTLSGSAPAGLTPWTLATLLVVTALARSAVILADIMVQSTWMIHIHTLLRKNMLTRIMERPGARAVPYSPGEAVTRFRDDVLETVRVLNDVPFVTGDAIFSLIAIGIMLRINVLITLAVIVPFFAVIITAQLAGRRTGQYCTASLAATGSVTGFIGEMFGALQAIRVSAAEANVLNRFKVLNTKRQHSAIKDRLFNEIVNSVFWNTINLATGAILILAGQGIRAGTFSVGDFALFIYYLGSLTRFTGGVGMIMLHYKQAGVSLGRMQFLMQGTPPADLVKRGSIYTHGALPDVSFDTQPAPFEGLSVKGLSYHFPDTGRGIDSINLEIKRGSFVVITGRIGSGKTTLLQTLLGLLTKDAGEIHWNGGLVSDPASFFVPPLTAYTAQIPRFSAIVCKITSCLVCPKIGLICPTRSILPRSIRMWPNCPKGWRRGSDRRECGFPVVRCSAPPPRACLPTAPRCTCSMIYPVHLTWKRKTSCGNVFSHNRA